MSVVAVRRTNGFAYISADKQVTWGDNKIINSNLSKLRKIGNIIFGSSGSVKEASLFEIYLQNHKPLTPSRHDILDFFSEFSEWAKAKDDSFALQNQYIIIYGNCIYETFDYDIREVGEFGAIGSGMFLALGAMRMGADTKQAVGIAKEYDAHCGGKTVTYKIKLNKK